MFSVMRNALFRAESVDLGLLARRFDLAMTKKLAVVKLPPAFWSNDPKINPPGEQLLLAALLLDDGERCAMAASVVVAEQYRETQELGAEQVIGETLHRVLDGLPGEVHGILADRALTFLGVSAGNQVHGGGND